MQGSGFMVKVMVRVRVKVRVEVRVEDKGKGLELRSGNVTVL